jgi:hypothetical protein
MKRRRVIGESGDGSRARQVIRRDNRDRERGRGNRNGKNRGQTAEDQVTAPILIFRFFIFQTSGCS